MKTEKVEKLITNFLDETEYAILTRNLKQVLNHELLLKKFHRVIKSNQKARLRPYFDMNTTLRKNSKE